MLADPKSKALVDNFAGQWLRLRNVADWKPDPDKFKEFDADAAQRFRTRDGNVLSTTSWTKTAACWNSSTPIILS